MIDKINSYQCKEITVIQNAYAVIEPFAMVIKNCHASVAITAVFCPIMHVCLAYLALVIEL